jgi:hypothetical protein
MRRCIRWLLLLMLCAVAWAPLSSSSAYADAAGACTASETLSLTSPLKAKPALTPIAFALTGSATCTPVQRLDWYGQGALDVGASCGASISLTGHATFLVDRVLQSTFYAGGAALVQSWTFAEEGAGTFTAQGSFLWAKVGEIRSCASATGTSTIELNGVMAYLD